MNRAILCLAAVLVASAGVAQPPGGPGAAGGMPANEVIFDNNDANGDGEITRAEADEAGLPLSQNWDMFDLDSDGKVVAEELDAARGNFGGGPGGGGPGGGAAAAGGAAAGAGQAASAGDEEDDDEDDESAD